MRKAVYPGSFDPITLGHIDLIKRISRQFDEVVILISESPEKSYLFTVAERSEMISAALSGLSNVRVDSYHGLTVDYVRLHAAQVIVRGLRAVVDFEYEMTMASMNRKLAPEIETMLVFAAPDAYFISSRGVKEVAKFGGALEGLVPANVIPMLQKRLNVAALK